jgi:hypothetical protein
VTPLAIDLFCGLGGWTEGLLSEGYRVIGYDIERHEYGDMKYPGELVIQDVLTIHGSQFKGAALIVASPPCQEYSYMAMPWCRAKNIAKEYRSGARDVKQLTALFDACFRIQREASEAAGHHIPMVVENVRGAIPWVGRSRWNFGSFHLWGDVPALMPIAKRAVKVGGIDFNDFKNGKGTSPAFNDTRHSAYQGQKVPGFRFDGAQHQPLVSGVSKAPMDTSVTHPAAFGWKKPNTNSKSNARKAASAMIAKIPLVLSQHIARVYKPSGE